MTDEEETNSIICHHQTYLTSHKSSSYKKASKYFPSSTYQHLTSREPIINVSSMHFLLLPRNQLKLCLCKHDKCIPIDANLPTMKLFLFKYPEAPRQQSSYVKHIQS